MTDAKDAFVIEKFLHIQKMKRGTEVIKNFIIKNEELSYSKKNAIIGLISAAIFSLISTRVR
jgi:hypothetical protein